MHYTGPGKSVFIIVIVFGNHKMIKYFNFTTVVVATLLLLFAGCTPETNEIEKALQIEPAKQQPAEPVKIEPPAVEPEIAIPTPEPVEVKQPEPDPAKPEPVKAEPVAITTPKPKAIQKTLIKDINEDYTKILNEYVNGAGMVNYKMLRRNRSELKRTLDKLAKITTDDYNSWTKNEKIAFWINAYNLHMLKIITSNYPIETSRYKLIFWPPTSIRHISGIWSSYKAIIMNEEFTLAEIDHRFFQNTFDDPRIFFAISRASMSGPPLRNEIYKGEILDRQLDDQVKKFLASPNGSRIDKKAQEVHLSAIMESKTYGPFFMKKYQTDKKFKDQEPYVRAVLNFITKYTSTANAYYLERANYSVKFIKYDWRLNE